MYAMPLLLAILCLLAIAYRYYSAFIAARIAVLDDSRPTPAVVHNDGQNYHPTAKWVLFGHHFAAISGAGPLIGPVLAAQFGYLPGLLWIVIGVCLGGAVQDFLVLVASMRRDGRSLAQIAFGEIGKTAGTAAMMAILFIIVIALAGLGKVVVKALGGEEVKYPANSQLVLPAGQTQFARNARGDYDIPAGAELIWSQGEPPMVFHEAFKMRSAEDLHAEGGIVILPQDKQQPALAKPARLVPGSSWGTFTIACTVPIALFVGLYMYRIRKGHVVEASLIGAALTIGATFIGGFVPGSPIERWFDLQDKTVVYAMAAYGFIASVLPVWVLLCPRDYLSSFLKIGTILLLVGGTMIANPKLQAPAINHAFASGGPTVTGHLFPFLFITIMCGAISGFHTLVSSGTSPKMIKKESHARTIGYGAMLIEGLVGVVAMIAAATLPMKNYYAMNTDLDKVPKFQKVFEQIDPHNPGPGDTLQQDEIRSRESLRGRTGGAVTLAVGMARIFDNAVKRFFGPGGGGEAFMDRLYKYWYHFAIMFEALFILTTIDTGTRIGRFLLQEVAGKVHPKLGQTNWWPGAIASTFLIVLAWGYFINANSMAAIWPMFGVANQMLAVIALAIVSVVLVNEGKMRYMWVTLVPMLVVMVTTSTGAVELFIRNLNTAQTQWTNPPALRNVSLLVNSAVQGALIAAMLTCAMVVVVAGAMRVWKTTDGFSGPAGSGRRFAVIPTKEAGRAPAARDGISA